MKYCGPGQISNINHLKAVITSLKKESGSQKLVQSMMRGNYELPFLNDEVEFRQIKFSETSYKNGKCKFYLAIVILDGNNPIQISVSPQIFLESRKKTYSEKIITMRSGDVTESRTNLFNPFLPIATEVILEKGIKSQNQTESIGKDLQGILDYFSCPTVRNKIFHPLFLFMRFPEVVNLYYNQELITQKPEVDTCEFLEELMFQIFVSLNSQKPDNHKQSQYKPLLLTLNADQEKYHFEIQRISKYIRSLDGLALQYSPSLLDSQVPSTFKKIEFDENLGEAYRLIYPHLSNLNYQIIVEGKTPERSQTNTAKNIHFQDGQGSTQEIFTVRNDPSKRVNMIKIKTFHEKSMLNGNTSTSNINASTVSSNQGILKKTLNPNPVQHAPTEVERNEITHNSREPCNCLQHMNNTTCHPPFPVMQQQPINYPQFPQMQAPPMMLQPNYPPQFNPQFNPQINPQFNPQINPQFNPQINPQFNPQINPQFNPQINPQLNPQINPQLNPQINPQLNPSLNNPQPFMAPHQIHNPPQSFVHPPQFNNSNMPYPMAPSYYPLPDNRQFTNSMFGGNPQPSNYYDVQQQQQQHQQQQQQQFPQIQQQWDQQSMFQQRQQQYQNASRSKNRSAHEQSFTHNNPNQSVIENNIDQTLNSTFYQADNNNLNTSNIADQSRLTAMLNQTVTYEKLNNSSFQKRRNDQTQDEIMDEDLLNKSIRKQVHY